jgi:Icc-related predicted phosphoesterase
MRLLVASDLHAAEGAYRKLLNAVRLGIWKADAILVAGDLAGKSLVPLVRANGYWRGRQGDRELIAHDQEELDKLMRSLADRGLYGIVVTEDELAELSDPAALEQRFTTEIVSRIKAWIGLAEERLAESGTPLYLIPGNDDPYALDPVLDGATGVINADGRIVRLPDGRELLGFASSNPTPWDTPRELAEPEIDRQLRDLTSALEAPEAAVLMTHVPPFESSIDTVPLLDAELRPVVSGGQIVQVACGSTAVRSVIEDVQPALTLHGHVHESPGHVRLGKTLCVNAGSEAAVGILRACLVDLDDRGVRAQRVEA